MAHLGHPLIGDTKYGGHVTFWCDRLPLHCLSLVARDLSGQILKCFAPIPEEFLAALVAVCDGELQGEQWQQLFREKGQVIPKP